MKTYLSHRGYAIEKKNNEALIEKLKKELTVSPRVNSMMGQTEATSFPVYRESDKKIYLPKNFGLDRFGAPNVIQMEEGEDCPNINFQGQLRPIQEEPVQAFLQAIQDPTKMGGILSLPCGFGKCLGKDTPILMYDGTVKMVQDIKIGDLLMGDDSTPRTVLSTCTGEEEMFDIIPTKGDIYTVNRSHILSLKDEKGTIFDLSVDDYLKQEETLYGYRMGVEFPFKNVPHDPYLIGYSFVNYTADECLPMVYKCNARNIRLHVLAGIIDSMKDFTITVTSEKRLDDIIYLARSLGFAAYKNKLSTTIHGNGIEDIPTKVHHIHLEGNVLMTRITPKSVGMGRYYGFEIDGNHRFLLGDFTVTHNTVCALYLSSYFKKKTLIVCHTQFLMDQWIERIEQYLPNVKTGKIKQNKCEIKGTDLVIASLQSLAMRDYDSDIFKSFGFVILDECHHLGAEVFSRCLSKITCRRMLGLSATLKRKDGLSKVFEWHLGKAVYTIQRKDSDVHILVKRYYDPHSSYSKEAKIWNTGKLNVAKMINQICDFPPRNYMIVQTLKNILIKEPNRKVLILSERRNHLQALEKLLRMEKYESIGYYIGGMNKKELDEGASKDIILATFQLASEAMDIPKLNTLILGSPVSSIEQPIGRIQRKKKEEREYIPLVIDILDEFSIFERQGWKRIAFYKKNDYTIEDSVKELKEKLTNTDVKYQIIEDEDDVMH